MAESGWFDQNRARAFPFVTRTVAGTSPGPVTVQKLPRDCVVDAGFIVGPSANFESDNDDVYLERVRREGSFLYFDFTGTSSGLAGITLTFVRNVSVGRYVQEFIESNDDSLSITDSLSEQDCAEPLLSGFIVTGDLTSLLEILPGDGVIEGNDGSYGVIEPGCIQNLSNAYVTGIAVANVDRTHVQAANACDEISYPFEEDALFIRQICISGDVRFQAGFNAEVQQDSTANRLFLRAVVGGGEGQPCEEVPLYDDETPPAGSTLLTGGPSCFEVLRSVNGSAGPRLNLQSGLGVVVQPDPSTHTIVIDADFTGMVGCYSEDTLEDTEIVVID